MPLAIDVELVGLMLDRGLVTCDELSACIDEQSTVTRGGQVRSLIDLAVERGVVTAAQARRVVKALYDGFAARIGGPAASPLTCQTCECAFTVAPPPGLLVIICPQCLTLLDAARHGDTMGKRLPDEAARVDVDITIHENESRNVPDPLVGIDLQGYRMECGLGAGAFGNVYRARHLASNEVVAIKVLAANVARDREVVQRFLREARLAETLDHPNIRSIREAGSLGDHHCLVMDYIRGESLSSLIKRRGPLPLPLVLSIGVQVSDAIDYASTRGVIHRDIKPANILLDEFNVPRIVDYGLARWTDGSASLTETGQIMGTPQYMSPEQCRGEPVDVRADIYALGCTIYYCLVGSPPFDAGTPMATIFQQINSPPPNLSKAIQAPCPGLSSVLWRMLAKSPADRYGSAAILTEEFRRLLRGDAPRDVVVMDMDPRVSVVAPEDLKDCLDLREQLDERHGVKIPLGEILARRAGIRAAEDPAVFPRLRGTRTLSGACLACGRRINLATAEAVSCVCDANEGITIARGISLLQRGDGIIEFRLDPGTLASAKDGDLLLGAAFTVARMGRTRIALDFSRMTTLPTEHAGWLVDLGQRLGNVGGYLAAIFEDARIVDALCAIGIDQFVRIYRTRRSFEARVGHDEEIAERALGIRSSSKDGDDGRLSRTAHRPPRAARANLSPTGPVELWPGEAWLRYLYDEGRFDKIVEQLATVGEGTAEAVQAHYYKVVALYKLGRFNDAMRELARSREVNGDHPQYSFYEGLILLKQGSTAGAIDAFSRLLQWHPRHVKALHFQGEAHLARGDLPKALSCFAAARAVNPRYAWAVVGAGRAYLRLGELPLAESQFELALEIQPGFAVASFYLACAAASRGDPAAAKRHLEAAKAQGFHQPEILHTDPSAAVLRNDPRLARIVERTQPRETATRS